MYKLLDLSYQRNYLIAIAVDGSIFFKKNITTCNCKLRGKQ